MVELTQGGGLLDIFDEPFITADPDNTFSLGNVTDFGNLLGSGDTSDLGDIVGNAWSLANLLKTGLSTGADILGGGDAKGGAGFVSQKNPATQAALEAQMSRIYGSASRQTTSSRGDPGRPSNRHSDAIIRGFNQNAVASFSRILAAARSGGQRVYAKPREAL